MSGEDIYPLIPPVHFRSLRTPFARRVLPLILVVVIWQIYFSSPSRPLEPALTTSSSSDLPPDPVSPRPSLPQSPVQQSNEQRLQGIVNRKQSYFDPALWSSFKPPSYSPVKPTQRLYPQTEDEVTAGEGQIVRGHVPVTAVFLSWKRKRGLDLVVQMTAKHPYIREIIIWNNNVEVNLQPAEFLPLLPEKQPPHLRIFNAPANVHDFAKHTACAMATYGTCYFNDDDWLNVYMDALYTKYIDTGGESNPRIIANTMPIIHLEHRRWRFSNPDIDLHAGFAWLGTGSFVPKSLSARFLDQMSSLPTSVLSPSGSHSGPLSPDKTSLCDMFFSVWTNTWPEQSPNELVPIDVEGEEVGWSRGKGVDQWAVVYDNLLDAVRRLHEVLDSRDPYLSPYPFHRTVPQPAADARAPCAKDGCLFLTSFNPFPSPSDLSYPPRTTRRSYFWPPWASLTAEKVADPTPQTRSIWRFDPFEIKHIKEHEALFNAVDKERNDVRVKWPDEQWWTRQGSWHLAVNGYEKECWDSGRPPLRGDYIGLHLVSPISIYELTVIGNKALKGIGEGGLWEVQTMSVGSSKWVVRTIIEPANVFVRPSGVIESSFALDDDAGEGSQKIRKFRLVARRTGEDNVEVCGWDVDGTAV